MIHFWTLFPRPSMHPGLRGQVQRALLPGGRCLRRPALRGHPEPLHLRGARDGRRQDRGYFGVERILEEDAAPPPGACGGETEHRTTGRDFQGALGFT